jgi:hypothetical protein
MEEKGWQARRRLTSGELSRIAGAVIRLYVGGQLPIASASLFPLPMALDLR